MTILRLVHHVDPETGRSMHEELTKDQFEPVDLGDAGA
jgi:hypothetical protein